MGNGVEMLVAEDSPDDVLLLERAFCKAGLLAGIRFVRDGLEAKEFLVSALQVETQPRAVPKVLLLDLKMPRLDGFEVLQWVRREARLRELPVVVLSSSQERRDVDRAYALGASSYLAKPSNAEGFVEIVQLVHTYWALWNQPNEFEGNGR